MGTYKNFLTLGIISTMLFTISCSRKTEDYSVEADWKYINASKHKISIEGYYNFTLNPGESKLFKELGKGPNNLTEKDYISPFHLGAKMIIDNSENIFLENQESICNSTNYEYKKIKSNYYMFTYQFTDILKE